MTPENGFKPAKVDRFGLVYLKCPPHGEGLALFLGTFSFPPQGRCVNPSGRVRRKVTQQCYREPLAEPVSIVHNGPARLVWESGTPKSKRAEIGRLYGVIVKCPPRGLIVGVDRIARE